MEQKVGGLNRHNPKPDQRTDSHILDVIPESAGPRLATAGGGAIYSVREPGSQAFLTESHFVEVMLAPALRNRMALGSDKMQEYDAPVGATVIYPANVEGRAIWSSTKESVIVALRPERLGELAARELDADHVALQPPAFGTVDLKALHIAQLLKMELLRQETASELYADSLVTLFGIHLLRTCSGVNRLPAKANGGLCASSARRVQEFLNENLSRKLSIAELAAICGLSPFHFIRAFAKTFGQTPHRYLLVLRLAFAEKLLVEGNTAIADIAYLSGFSSQSHLTAAMKKYRHATPAEIRSSRQDQSRFSRVGRGNRQLAQRR
ncbi:helix-turn-helix domain-containing protein [Chelativorans alearense]|uniref:helix-turn-helix domain-containing protein n=1 Tax=Chelativorans alearense TaxID=2681495 RepID=UPI0013D0B27A